MLVYTPIFILISAVYGWRDYSAKSWLIRKVLEKALPNDGSNEHTRITQTPIIQIHLEKTEVPPVV